MKRVVLDTNIFISGIFWQGNHCSRIIDRWEVGKYTLVSSIEIIDELTQTLRNFKIEMPEEMIHNWRKMIIENAVMVVPVKRLDVVKDDPDDNKFFEVAVAGNAGLIVSQDKHLLRIKEYRGIRVLTPKEFLKIA